MKKEAFRKIPRSYFAQLARSELTRAEYKVMLTVIDKTYGWDGGKRREADIPLSYFESFSGLTRKAIKSTLTGLIAQNLIQVVNSETNRKARVYRITDHTEWKLGEVLRYPSGEIHKYPSNLHQNGRKVSLWMDEKYPSGGIPAVPTGVPLKKYIKKLSKERTDETKNFNTIKEHDSYQEKNTREDLLSLSKDERNLRKTKLCKCGFSAWDISHNEDGRLFMECHECGLHYLGLEDIKSFLNDSSTSPVKTETAKPKAQADISQDRDPLAAAEGVFSKQELAWLINAPCPRCESRKRDFVIREDILSFLCFDCELNISAQDIRKALDKKNAVTANK